MQLMFNGSFPLSKLNLASLIEAADADIKRQLPLLASADLRVKKVVLSKDWSEMAIIAQQSGADFQT